jgi:hypothetical protein
MPDLGDELELGRLLGILVREREVSLEETPLTTDNNTTTSLQTEI